MLPVPDPVYICHVTKASFPERKSFEPQSSLSALGYTHIPLPYFSSPASVANIHEFKDDENCHQEG